MATALGMIMALPGGVARASATGPSGPAIALSKPAVQPGQRVLVTLTGWTARNVTLAVCGNLARRGSGDCNMVASQALKLLTLERPTQTELTVFEPPTPCPCVVRASDATQREVAFAAIEVAGVATGPVVGPVLESLVSVEVDVRRASVGLVAAARASLGGPRRFGVTVTVWNRSAETLRGAAVAGAAGRQSRESLVAFDMALPPVGPREVWQHRWEVTVPAPTMSRLVWDVTVSGAGPPETALASTRSIPIALALLATVFVVDVGAMVWRLARRKLGRPRPPGDDPSGASGVNLRLGRTKLAAIPAPEPGRIPATGSPGVSQQAKGIGGSP